MFDDEMDEIVEGLLSRVPTVRLADFPAYPFDVAMEWRAALQVMDVARRVLKLPPRIMLRFVSAPGETRGAAEHRGGVYRVSLNLAELSHIGLVAETLFHELSHVSDFYDGTFSKIDRAEFERRAIDFSNRMMETWEWRS